MPSKLYTDILALVARCTFVQVGSISPDGYPAVKTMFAPRYHEGLRIFYGSTNTSCMRVRHFEATPKACLYFFDGSAFTGLMLQGEMTILHDQKHKDLLWREGDIIYYPLGPTDPDYCVLRFVAEHGRYYEDLISNDFRVLDDGIGLL